MPAILSTHGFGGSKDDDNQKAIGKGFVGQGYAVLSYSGLGFGKTDCKIELDDPDWDGKAGKQMDDVLAGTRAYTNQATGKSAYLRSIAMESKGDPRVGMIGGSYGGQIQYAVASQDPRIDAIIPIITWNDLTYSLAPGNVAKKEWIDLFFSDGIASGVENGTNDPGTLAGGCPNFTDQACVGAVEHEHRGLPRRRHRGAGQARVGGVVREEDQDPHPPRPGPEGHLVQPQRGLGDLQDAQGAGHAGEDGLAVVGPLRLDAGPRRARLRRPVPARLLPRPTGSWTG